MKVDQRWQVSIGEDNTVSITVDTTFHGPRGSRKAPTGSRSFSLEEPQDIHGRGGGKGAWTFADSTLPFTRTFPSGAFRINLVLSRNGEQFSCTANEAFAREGNSSIVLESPFGGEVTILGAHNYRRIVRSNARLACTRFRRHRVRCFHGTGGASWRGGSSRESSSLRRCA